MGIRDGNDDDDDYDDDDDNDDDSVATSRAPEGPSDPEAPERDPDFRRMVATIHSFLPEAKAKGPVEPPPRCVTEGVFATSDTSPRVSVHLPLAHRLEKVRTDVASSVSSLVEDGKK